MFRILHNRWGSNFRTWQRRPGEVLTDEIEWGHGTAYAPDTGRSAVLEALDALAHSDVRAAVVFVSLGTVTSRVKRGRNRLGVALAHVVLMDGPISASEAH